ncbi:BrnT family toxin [Marinomonas sp. A79]|uniref:BrnT family toxin n=1 Tax=Marinomonas vulgaris TaxID=2823372 RepID=A0ABS5HAU4_9GAMM|nr:BrnT family toxin [Marinomonas vulgaris]MBR7888777.1 BrnT family toxin [Marinomonas vulgaris]
MYKFEFDTNKSSTNLNKHGINFIDAQELWSDPDLLQVKAKSEGEQRYLIIGTIADKFWSAVITYREDTIRIISVRRSRKAEVSIYES